MLSHKRQRERASGGLLWDKNWHSLDCGDAPLTASRLLGVAMPCESGLVGRPID